MQALAKQKPDDEACGEIATAHPGYLGSQDTFYVGTLKGVGRVYPTARQAILCSKICREGADLHRHLQQGRPCQALDHQDADHGSRSAQ